VAERDLVITTGADWSHATPLLNLLFSLDRYEPATRVIVYDLGLAPDTLDLLRRQRRTVVEFRYQDYPPHIRFDLIRNYAWKPALVRDAMRREGLPLLYLDAGDLLHAPLARIRHELATTGFYSPVSSDDVKRWTHPGTLAAMQVEPELLELRNRNGAVVGFGAGDVARGLLEDWYEAAMRPEVIVPSGSSHENHRFDQSVLTILSLRASRRHGLTLADDLLDVSVHNDRRDFAQVNLAMCQPASVRKVKRLRRGAATAP
jgi:hypothetical protein